MGAPRAQNRRQGTAYCAFFFAAFSCVLGLSFCLIKSPQAKSQAYMAAAFDAIDRHDDNGAAMAALEAVKLNPLLPQGWQLLSEMLQKTGDASGAAKARSIAALVQQNPEDVPPVYAMPAEFKLSLLTLAETRTP